MENFLNDNFIIIIMMLILAISVFYSLHITFALKTTKENLSFATKRMESQSTTIRELRQETLDTLKNYRIERNKHLDTSSMLFVTNEGEIARSVRCVTIFKNDKSFSHIECFIKRKKGDKFINEKVYPIFLKHHLDKYNNKA